MKGLATKGNNNTKASVNTWRACSVCHRYFSQRGAALSGYGSAATTAGCIADAGRGRTGIAVCRFIARRHWAALMPLSP